MKQNIQHETRRKKIKDPNRVLQSTFLITLFVRFSWVYLNVSKTVDPNPKALDFQRHPHFQPKKAMVLEDGVLFGHGHVCQSGNSMEFGGCTLYHDIYGGAFWKKAPCNETWAFVEQGVSQCVQMYSFVGCFQNALFPYVEHSNETVFNFPCAMGVSKPGKILL